MKRTSILRSILVYSISFFCLIFLSLTQTQASNLFLDEYTVAFPAIHLANQELELAQEPWKEMIRTARRAGLTLDQSGLWQFALSQIETLEREYQATHMFPLIHRYAWGIPSDQAIQIIAQYSPLVEIGAGNGYWARLLFEQGADIVAYDNTLVTPEQLWFPVAYGTEEAVRVHPDRTLFLCWPPQMELDGVAFHTLLHYGGTYVIYVGELPRQTEASVYTYYTGDPQFFELLNAQYFLESSFPLPNWPGYSDQLYIFRRKPSMTLNGPDDGVAPMEDVMEDFMGDFKDASTQRQSAGAAETVMPTAVEQRPFYVPFRGIVHPQLLHSSGLRRVKSLEHF